MSFFRQYETLSINHYKFRSSLGTVEATAQTVKIIRYNTKKENISFPDLKKTFLDLNTAVFFEIWLNWMKTVCFHTKFLIRNNRY